MARKKKKSKRAYMLLAIIIVLFLLGIVLITKSIDMSKKNLSNLLYSQSINQDNTYDVSIYPNSQYSDYDNVIDPNESYPSKIVKDINLYLKYNYSGSLVTNLSYKYRLDGKIIGEYKSGDENTNGVIWEKEYKLIEETIKDVTNEGSFNINETYPLHFATYNNEVEKYVSTLKIPITAYMLVTFNVDVTGSINGVDISDSKVTTYKIPLNQQVFKITEEQETTYSNNYTRSSMDEVVNKRRLIFGIVFLVGSIFTFILSFNTIFDVKQKTKYSIKLEKILKGYGPIIVEIVSPVVTKGYNVIEVKNFNELVDLEYELRVPITFYEIKSNKLGEFMITNEKTIYKYVLKDE